ncbi:MAG: thioredoxin family protein, partial [Phycisphaerales bacterium]|nr:thioredoxin family protein [Phycisphaerales bacterium]
NKLVMIDFYTTWCGPCKMLDKTTWKDEKVQQWLDENTVALKVDAEKLRPIAKKFNVSAYPTIVFINGDEEVVGRFVGYKPPEKFIGAAENAIAGVTELSIARKKVENDKNNPMLRNRLAGELVSEKKYKEALEHYEWCWEHGVENRPGFSGARVSFMLSDMSRLAQKYPAALTKMKSWRDKAKKNFDSTEAIRRNCTDYFALEKYLGTTGAQLLSIYDGLNERGDKGSEIQSWVGYHVKDEIFSKGRFEEYLEIENIDRVIMFMEMDRDRDYQDGTKDIIIKLEIDRALQPFEALLVMNRDKDASRLMNAILALDSSPNTFEKLRKVSTKIDRIDYIETINNVAKSQTVYATDE